MLEIVLNCEVSLPEDLNPALRSLVHYLSHKHRVTRGADYNKLAAQVIFNNRELGERILREGVAGIICDETESKLQRGMEAMRSNQVNDWVKSRPFHVYLVRKFTKHLADFLMKNYSIVREPSNTPKG